ncbi:MAG: hypothetical protein ACLFNX_04745 [Spirochaetaceae bacterium]
MSRQAYNGARPPDSGSDGHPAFFAAVSVEAPEAAVPPSLFVDAVSPVFDEAPEDSVPAGAVPAAESPLVCAAGFLAEPVDLLSVT